MVGAAVESLAGQAADPRGCTHGAAALHDGVETSNPVSATRGEPFALRDEAVDWGGVDSVRCLLNHGLWTLNPALACDTGGPRTGPGLGGESAQP